MKPESLSDWLGWLEEQHPKEIDLGLDRITKVAATLGVTNLNARVVTVAGTNGKGSFVSAFSSLLIANGRHVGTYTSPHLFKFNERIAIDGEPVSDEVLLEAFNAVYGALQGVSLTYFEFTTLVAFLIFKEAELDDVVLEIGLGGRLDAVNIIEPDYGVITSIGIDHTDYLGDSREQIALEKAGILREKTPLVLAEPDVPASLGEILQNRKLWLINKDFNVSAVHDSGAAFSVVVGSQSFTDLVDNGLSRHSVAAAVMLFLELYPDASTAFVTKVINSCSLSGRFQQIDLDGVMVILDVAHNLQAASLLKQKLQNLPLGQGNKRLALFAMMSDKDIAAVVECLSEEFMAWFLCELDMPRAANTSQLSNYISEAGCNKISVSKNARQALARARSLCQPGDQIVVFGTFFLVADILRKIEKL